MSKTKREKYVTNITRNMASKSAEVGGIFLVLRAIDVETNELDPFAVAETVDKAVGKVLEATTQKSGDYLLRVKSDVQASKLVRLGKLTNGQKVKCALHPTLNYRKCIISHPAITSIGDEKLSKELKAQGVLEVRGIKPTNRLKIVTVKGTSVPKYIKVGLLTVKTSPYYPMVRVCRNCWQIGHTTVDCAGKTRCGKCSGLHTADECTNDPFCGNCGADHTPAVKHCPLYIQERAITKLQVDRQIPPRKARKAFRKKNGTYIPLPEETSGSGFFDKEDADETEDVDAQAVVSDSEPAEEEVMESPPKLKQKKIKSGDSSLKRKAKKQFAANLEDEEGHIETE